MTSLLFIYEMLLNTTFYVCYNSFVYYKNIWFDIEIFLTIGILVQTSLIYAINFTNQQNLLLA